MVIELPKEKLNTSKKVSVTKLFIFVHSSDSAYRYLTNYVCFAAHVTKCQENATKSTKDAKKSKGLKEMWANMSQPSSSKESDVSDESMEIEEDFTGADALLSSSEK